MSKFLREEYELFKKEKNIVTEEAAYSWVQENIFLITEDFDKNLFNSLSKKISLFDKKFSKVKNKLPTIGNQIAQAEKELSEYLSGYTSNKSATMLLQKLNYFYDIYSTFFSRNLPSIIGIKYENPLFRVAKQHPDVKLNVLNSNNFMNSSSMENAFANALMPNGGDVSLKRKIYGKKLPEVNIKQTAKELLNLSYNELLDLTRIEKIPAMVTPEPNSTSPETEAGLNLGNANATPESEQLPTITENLNLLNEIDQNLLLKIKQYSKAVNLLKKSPVLARMPSLQKSVHDLDNEINQVLTSKVSAGKDWLASKIPFMSGGIDSKIANLTKFLKSFVDVWSTLRDRLNLDKEFGNHETLNQIFLDNKPAADMFNKVIQDKNLEKDLMNLNADQIEEASKELMKYFEEIKAASNIKTTPATQQSQSPQATQPTPVSSTAQPKQVDLNVLEKVAEQTGIDVTDVNKVVNALKKMGF